MMVEVERCHVELQSLSLRLIYTLQRFFNIRPVGCLLQIYDNINSHTHAIVSVVPGPGFGDLCL